MFFNSTKYLNFVMFIYGMYLTSISMNKAASALQLLLTAIFVGGVISITCNRINSNLLASRILSSKLKTVKNQDEAEHLKFLMNKRNKNTVKSLLMTITIIFTLLLYINIHTHEVPLKFIVTAVILVSFNGIMGYLQIVTDCYNLKKINDMTNAL